MRLLILFLTGMKFVTPNPGPDDETGWIQFNCNNIYSQLNLFASDQGCSLGSRCERYTQYVDMDPCQPLTWTNHTITKGNACAIPLANTLTFCGFNISAMEPGSLSCHGNLLSLHLSHNGLTKLENGVFDGLLAIRQIWVNNNFLHTIGNRVFPPSLDSLELIDLSYNQLTYLEPWFFQLPGLILIKASHNNMDHFVNTIDFDIKIKPVRHADNITIDMQYNKFEYFNPKDIYKYLGIQDITIEVLLIWELYKSRRMCLKYWENPFVCDCKMFHAYEKMKDLTSIFQVPQKIFVCQGPQTLKDRYLQDLQRDDLICDISTTDCPGNCNCTYVPAADHILVNCMNQELEHLPIALPSYFDLKEVQLHINMANNLMSNLENVVYFNRTSVLDLENNHIISISEKAVDGLQMINQLRFQNNALHTLPKRWNSQTWLNLRNVSLYGNPFSCDCELAWLPEWWKRHKSQVHMGENISCIDSEGVQKFMLEWDASLTYCHSPPNNVTIIAVIAALMTTTAIMCFALILVWKRRTQLPFLKRFIYHERNEQKMYDGFVCFADEDMEFVQTIVGILEDTDPTYRLYLHYRDFPLGQSITQSIAHGIENSQKVLFIISQFFVQSEWCLFELNSAIGISPAMVQGRILLILKDNMEKENLSETLRVLMNTVTYLKWDDRDFAKKLRDAMPDDRADMEL